MTTAETRTKLLTDDEFLFQEFIRLQWFFGLKREIRYHEERIGTSAGDSVAEHIYGMMVAFHYFWPLEDLEGKWDKGKMLSMITWHDADELVTGDTIGYLKDKSHRAAEAAALPVVEKNFPLSMRQPTMDIIREYEARESVEAKFVKAIDKIEPIYHLYNEMGKQQVIKQKTTFAQNASIKVPYFKEFPVIMRFYEVISKRMDDEGFFTKS